MIYKIKRFSRGTIGQGATAIMTDINLHGVTEDNKIQLRNFLKKSRPILKRYGRRYKKGVYHGKNSLGEEISLSTGYRNPNPNDYTKGILFGKDWNLPPIKTKTGTQHSDNYVFRGDLFYPKDSEVVSKNMKATNVFIKKK